jgi:hypothetical protein
MANSLELRVPFLDPEVFKVASTLPVGQRVTKETTKYALRRALEQIVPPHVLNRRKLGFPVPTRHWLAEGLHDWDPAGVHDLARHLRRGAHHARRPGHGLPRPALTGRRPATSAIWTPRTPRRGHVGDVDANDPSSQPYRRCGRGRRPPARDGARLP